jgi:hypothetical protein
MQLAPSAGFFYSADVTLQDLKMLRRKKPKLLRKRRLMDVGAGRRRVKRSLAVLKLRRRQRNYEQMLSAPLLGEAIL